MDAGLAWTIVGSAAGVVAAGAAVIGVLQVRQGRRAAGPSGDEPRQTLPLPGLVPGPASIGYVPALPSRFIDRAKVFGTVRDDILAHATVGLVGMGGAGKTILATAVARDPAVQAAFPGGVAWVRPASMPSRRCCRSASPPG